MNSAAMMNIQVDPEMVDAIGKARAADYRLGHRDARHAAAVIALKMDAEIKRLREALSELADRGTLSSNGELDWLIDDARTALGRNPETNIADKEGE